MEMAKWKSDGFIDMLGAVTLSLTYNSAMKWFPIKNAGIMIYSSHVAHWLLGGLGRHLKEVGEIYRENSQKWESPSNPRLTHFVHSIFIHSRSSILIAIPPGIQQLNSEKPWVFPANRKSKRD